MRSNVARLSSSLSRSDTAPEPVEPAYQLLDQRITVLLSFGLIVHPVIIFLLVTTQTVSTEVTLLHAGMYVLTVAFYIANRRESRLAVFIATCPYWFFSFMLHLYALAYWKSPETDLYAPQLSSTIALTALVASLSAAQAAFRLGKRRQRTLPPVAPFDEDAGAKLGTILIFAALPFVMLPLVIREVSFFDAVAGVFEPALWLGIVTLGRARGAALFRSPAMACAFGIVMLISLGLNARGILLSFSIVFALTYTGLTRLTFWLGLAAGFVGISAINAFSTITLAARLQGIPRDQALYFVSENVFSTDFLLLVFGMPTRLSSLGDLVAGQLDRLDQYLIYFFEGRIGLFERLTQMPHMDIVMARLPYPVPVDWNEIQNTILSSLPSFGQAKDIIYSDRVAWSLGLTMFGNIGRPLVTAAGEFYAMGGFFVLFIFYFSLMFSIFWLYTQSRRLFHSDFIASICIVVFSIYIVFSSTAISALAVPLRIYPIAFLLFATIRFLTTSRGTTQSKYHSGSAS